MWWVFFVVGIIFLSLGILDLRKYNKNKYKENITASTSMKPFLYNNENKQHPQIVKKKVIPLELTPTSHEKPQKEVDLTPSPDENPISLNKAPLESLEEKKKMWNEHWIVKKVKERFEKNPSERIEYGNKPLSSHSLSNQEITHNKEEDMKTSNNIGVFNSLLEQRKETIPMELTSYDLDNEKEKNNPSLEEDKEEEKENETLPSQTLEKSTDEKHIDKEKKDKEEEKEFDPFEIFGSN